MNRTLLLKILARTRGGRLVIVEGDTRLELGETSGITVEVRVLDRRAYRMVLRNGSIGMADSYAAGMWECDDLVGLVRLAARNMAPLDELRHRFAPVLIPGQRIGALLRRSTPARARRDIAAHYDLSNELFALFLDETMMYSCGLFERPGMTLREAQDAKLDRICRKLGLNPGDHVLEIGTGWGGFAIHAAAHYGCRVTTTTISEAQRIEAQARVDAAGLSDRITILDQDYRELTGRWHKMVSIEMIEAVGWRNLPVYLRKCGELLADDGLFCLQAITIDDRAYEVEKGTRSFANTRIFPGGFVPAQTPLLDLTARHTAMRAVHLEEIGPHYATTLRRWAENFGVVELAELERMGFDERFQRMWRFYLAYMEAGFAERRIGDIHLMLAGPTFRGESALLARAAGGQPLSAAVEVAGDEVEQQRRAA
ncbi:MAG: cyclopropane-fatty-acyl-phospholipid synthase family protein [Solirubrobacteraceae bacterium]